MERRWGVFRSLMILLVRTYRRFISPLFASSCRFYPTCSQYALASFYYLPIYKAVYYSAARIARCHPYNPGGVDFPPGVDEKTMENFINDENKE